MPNKVFNLKLDLNGQVIAPKIQIRRNDYDTNVFSAQILQNGVPVDITGWTPIFECLTPARKFIRDDGSEFGNMTVVDATNGKIEYTVSDKVFASLGDIDVAYFAFEKLEGSETKRLSTGNFYFTVIRDVMTGSVAVEDYLSQVTTLISDINQLKLEYETLNPANYATVTQLDEVTAQLADNTNKIGILNEQIAVAEYEINQKRNNPAYSFFGWSGEIDVNADGALDPDKAGEPFIVYDKDNNVYRMFYFGYKIGGDLQCLEAIAPQSIGPWTKTNVNVSKNGLKDRHKMCVLVDGYNNPVKINGKYHAYVVGRNPNKVIYHWETDNMANGWNETGVVINKGFAGDGTDTYACDAPAAVYDYKTKKIYLFYMAQSNDSNLKHRINRAVSNTPESGFSFDGVAIIGDRDWCNGWVGGCQPRLSEDGKWWFAFNGSPNPSSPGTEPEPSHFGFGIADSIDGYITTFATANMLANNEQFSDYSNIYPQPVEKSAVWRPFFVYSKELNKWLVYYNTGPGNGKEYITHAVQGYLKFVDIRVNNLDLRTAETKIRTSAIRLVKGTYRATVNFNLTNTNANIEDLEVLFRFRLNYNGSINVNVDKELDVFRLRPFTNSKPISNYTLSTVFTATKENPILYITQEVKTGTPNLNTYIGDIKYLIEQL